jgi:Xaa-Pro dipeptidase
MALHFTRDEFAARRRRAREEMAKAGLDGLLIFRQESMYYLTGYSAATACSRACTWEPTGLWPC